MWWRPTGVWWRPTGVWWRPTGVWWGNTGVWWGTTGVWCVEDRRASEIVALARRAMGAVLYRCWNYWTPPPQSRVGSYSLLQQPL